MSCNCGTPKPVSRRLSFLKKLESRLIEEEFQNIMQEIDFNLITEHNKNNVILNAQHKAFKVVSKKKKNNN